MEIQLCRHIKTNGTQCGSPALASQTFCFYHARLHRGHAGFRRALAAPEAPDATPHLHLSPLEDRDAIQSALSVIIHALAANQIETRRATALFYGLQLASMNAARLNSAPFPADVLVETTADEDGLELALPGATRTITTNIADEVYDKDEYQDEEEEEEDENQTQQEDDDMPEPKQSELLRAKSYSTYPEPHEVLPSVTYPPDTLQSTHS